MIDDFTYEMLKGCYDLANDIAGALFIVIVLSVFLAVWVVVLLMKLSKARRAYSAAEDEYIKDLLKANEKNGRKKKGSI